MIPKLNWLLSLSGIDWRKMKPFRIFIVDDNIHFINAVRRFFSVDKCIEIVGYAQTAKEALEQICFRNPDLVLIDFIMPEMDGAELTTLIKKETEAPRVILLSLYNEPAYHKVAKEVGADGFISKADFSENIFENIEKIFGNILPHEIRLCEPKL
jgi:DNA-binding NarL/FixJ family response regulator